MAHRARNVGWLFAIGVATLGGCTTSTVIDDPQQAPSEPPRPETTGPSDGAGRTPPPTAAPVGSLYYAYLASGACSDVAGKSGTWMARALFPDAPPEIRAAACSYRWLATSPTSPASPDLDALTSLGAELLTRSVDESPSRVGRPLDPGSLIPIPPDPGGAGAPTGVTGCDVCGRVLERQIFVILPADKMSLRTIVVATESGQFLSFDVKPPAGPAQVYSAVLPPAPNDTTYKQGRFPMLEAPF